jgi:hypothetical protein
MGRPSIRTPAMVERVLEQIELGEVGADVCNAKDGMPSWAAFKVWMQDDPELQAAYTRAWTIGVERNEAELLREARRKPVDSVDAQAQRTLVDTLKWRLSKRLPKDYGDRQQVEHSGGVSLNVVSGVPTGATEQSGEVAERPSRMSPDTIP